MSFESTTTAARKETKSLKATIPEAIVVYLNLESGDKLEWVMEMEGKQRVAVVRKKK